jgi:hypothetical protein
MYVCVRARMTNVQVRDKLEVRRERDEALAAADIAERRLAGLQAEFDELVERESELRVEHAVSAFKLGRREVRCVGMGALNGWAGGVACVHAALHCLQLGAAHVRQGLRGLLPAGSCILHRTMRCARR